MTLVHYILIDIFGNVWIFRPGILGANMGNYPWLADSWPTTNLVHNGKDSVNCCTSKHDTPERYYNGKTSFYRATPPAVLLN